MNLKNSLILGLFAANLILFGCSGPDSAKPRQSIRLWVAPSTAQEEFWKIAVERWNLSGLGLPVDFTTIPSTGNSEEAILKALMADSAPDISTNIFSGFAAQLAALGQVQDLAVLNGFSQLVAARDMQAIMHGWNNQGKAYVFPLYSNPTLIWWRKDILQRLGWQQPPKTFDDVYRLSAQYAQTDGKLGMQVMFKPSWEHRWFDFISYYYAASDGAPYVEGEQAKYNNAAGLSVMNFINTMFRKGWTIPRPGEADPLVSGTVLGAIRGPWDIENFKKLYPEVLKNIQIGPMLREQSQGNKSHTFADTKGLVIFNHSQVKQQAFDFISWVLTNSELNLLWLEKTGLPPARGHLAEIELYKAFYAANPLAKVYADYVDVAVPPAFSEHTIEVQKIMSNMMEAVQYGKLSPEAAVTEAVAQTNKFLGRL